MSLSSIYRPNEDISNPSLDSVLAKLAVMNTDQLKAFATEHQDDMIMLGAAQAVHAKREEYAQKANAQQGTPMPPVNQQVVQNMDPAPQMPQGMPPQGGQGMPPQGMPPQGMPLQGGGQLPEQQGIAQLPTPNIDNMAGGGIVAFADGGSADEDTMYSGEPVLRMADGGHIPRYQGVPTAMGGDGSVVKSSIQQIDDANIAALSPLAQQFKQAEQQYIAAAKSGDQKAIAQYMQAKEAVRKQLEETAVSKFGNQAPKILSSLLANDSAAPAVSATAPTAAPFILPYGQTKATNVLGNAAPAPAAPGPRPPAPGTKPAAPPPPPAGIATLKPEDYRKQLDSLMPKETVDPFAAQRLEIANAEKLAKEKQLSDFEKEVAERGVLGAKQEERIGKRETELGKQKDLNTNMSIIEAGLAMMQSKGRGLAGIAEGAAVGTKMYASGIERLRAAQEKIDDARDNLDTLRRNEANMTSRERRLLRNDIENTTVSAKKDALAGLQQVYNINKQDAREIFKTFEASREKALDRETQVSEGALNRKTQERIAAMPSGQMQVLSALGGGNIETGLRLMTEIQAGKKTMAQAYEAYITAMAGKDTTLTPALTPQQFVAQMQAVTMLAKGVPEAKDGKPDRQ